MQTDLSKTGFIAGKILPYVMIAFIDFYLVLLLGAWLFDWPLPAASQGPLLLLVLVYVAGLIVLGGQYQPSSRPSNRRSSCLFSS